MTSSQPRVRLALAVDRRFPNDHSFLEGVVEKRLARKFDLSWYMRSKTNSRVLEEVMWLRSPCLVLPSAGASGDKSLLKDYVMLICSLAKIYRRLGEFRPDAMFVRNDPVYLLLALLYGWKRDIPVLFQLSHLKEEELLELAEHRTWMSRYRSKVKAIIARCIRDFGIKRCAYLFPISDAMRDYLVSRLDPQCEVAPIPLGVDVGEVTDLDKQPSESLPIEGPNFSSYILYVGTLAQSRQPEIMIDAFSKLNVTYPDLGFVLVGGSGDPNAKKVLQEYVSDKSFAKKVEFINDVPRLALRSLIEGARCCLSVQPRSFVFSTISPTKLMEYLQYGAPVVATKGVLDQEKVIRESKCGVLVEFDADSISTGITWVLENGKEAREMADSGRRYLIENRSYNDLAIQLEQHVMRCIEKYHGTK